MFTILLACLSLIGHLCNGATSTEMMEPGLEDLDVSRSSSSTEQCDLAPPTTEAPVTHPSHDLRRRSEYVYTGETLIPGNFTDIESVGSICGYVTSDIRKWAIDRSSHVY